MILRLKKTISKVLVASLLITQLGNNVIVAHNHNDEVINKGIQTNAVENDIAYDENIVSEETNVVEDNYSLEGEVANIINTAEVDPKEELILEGHAGKKIDSEIDETTITMPVASNKDINWVNNVGAYPMANGGQTQLVNEWEDTKEYISPLTGELTLNVTDLELPGRNEFNLKIGRIFRSENALPGQKKYSYNQISFEEGNYYHDTYELGLGWSFTFPSVELKGNAIYYHTGTGEVYLVNTGSTYSNLENYTEKDIKFTTGSYTTSTKQTAKYCLQNISGEKQYFNDEGLLLEMVDRFKNVITFKYKYYLKEDTYDDEYIEVAESDKYSKKALLYQITDSVNRDVIFNYNTSGSLDVKVFEPRTSESDDPSINTSRAASYTISYKREKQKVVFIGQLGDDGYERQDWKVQKLVAVDKTQGSSVYGGYTQYEYGKSVSVACMCQYHYDDINTEEVVPGKPCDYCGDLDFLTLKKVIKPTSQISYEYEKVRKAIDTFYGLYQEGYPDDIIVAEGDVWWAFYDTTRISKRSEQYKQTVQNGGAFTGAINVQDYSYAGKYTYSREEIATKDESGYTFRNGGENAKERDMIQRIKNEQEYTVTIVNPEYTQTQIIYKNARPIKEVVTDLKTQEVKTTTYTYNDISYPNKVTYSETTTTVPGKGSCTTAKETLYESKWGYVAQETSVLDLADYKNTSTKEKHTTYYTYHEKYGFQTSKKYYQNNDTLITEKDVYDSLGRKTQSIDGSGKITYYTYPAISAKYPGNLSKMYDLNVDGTTNNTITYAYDSKTNSVIEKEVKTVDGQARTTTYTYEGIQGKPLTITDANNNRITYTYYPNGKVKTITYPQYKDKDNKSYYRREVHSYTAKDLGVAAINRALCEVKVDSCKVDVGSGETTTLATKFIYCDDNGEIWRTFIKDYVTNTNYGVVDYLRDVNNKVITERTQNTTGATTYDPTSYEYDGTGRVTKVTDANGSQYVITYNDIERSKLVEFIPKGGTSENHYKEYYDVDGNVIVQQVYPNGISSTPIKISKEYDIVGNLVKIVDPKGYITQYEYNALNQITKEIDPEGHISRYTYDNNGNNLTFTQSEEGQEFTYTNIFNSANEVIKSTSPAGKVTTYTYDKLGNVSSETSPSGKVKTSTYYGNGHIATETIVGNKRTYYYDINEAITGITTTGVGQSIEKDYTGNGLIVSRGLGDLKTQFTFDINSSLKTLTDPFGLTVSYSQDRLNRVENIEVDGKIFNYSYYADGMVKSITLPVASGQLTSNYTYDNMNRLKELKNTLNGTVISKYNYTYDANSNIIKVVEIEQLTNGKTRNRTSNYTYDKLDQLLTISSTDGRNISYAYDSRGNRSVEDVQLLSETLAEKELTEIELENNRVTTSALQVLLEQAVDVTKENVVDKVEAQATIDISTKLEFVYNDFDELSECKSGEGVYTYTYDAEGIRVAKQSNQGTIKYYHNDNGEVIAEANANGEVTAQNIWGDRILARKVNNQYYYYVTNGHGDVTQIVNEQGQIINTYQYDEWGNILDQVESITNPIRYAAEYYDEESGFYYLRARYYDPSIGRFIGEDPSRDGTNWYLYCYNNPLKYTDPSGNIPVETVVDIISVASSARDFVKKPSLKTAATLAWDVAATAVPYIPGSYVKKGAKVAVKASKKTTQKSVIKAVKKTQCFIAGTLIATENGLKPIEEIQVGDYVWASNPETGEIVLEPVIQTFKNQTDSIVELVINGEKIETTEGHPFWVEEKGWVTAAALDIGDKVRVQSGESISIEETNIKLISEKIDVYNFEVRDLHTYFVGKDNILVHNACKPKKATIKKTGSRPPNLSPQGAGRKGAFREAKRKNGIPVTEHPIKVSQNRDKRGNLQAGKVYEFKNGTKIRDDAGGHKFPDDPLQDRGPHFNDPAGNHYDY